MAIVDSRTVLRVSTTASLPTLAGADDGTLAYDQQVDQLKKWDGTLWSALAAGLVGSGDIGTLSMLTGQFLFQYRRLTLSGTNRLSMAGTAELVISDFGMYGDLYVGAPKDNVSYRVRNDTFFDVWYRLRLSNQQRVTLDGTADLIITDDFASRARLVLSGFGG